MKIADVRATPFQVTRSRIMGNANTPDGQREDILCAVEITTDCNLTGLSIGTCTSLQEIGYLAETVLLGKDPRGVVALWKRLTDSFKNFGGTPFSSESVALLDMALWDLKAKAENTPLWRALGGCQTAVYAYASDNSLAMSNRELAAWYTKMAREFGVRAGKLKIGLDGKDDIERIEIARDALKYNSDAPVIMLDADEIWSPKLAVRKITEIERYFDITFVEAPCSHWDHLGHKRVSDGISAAVCNSERLSTPGEYLPHFDTHSLGVIQCDLNRLGITGALILADTAFGYEIPVTLAHTAGNIHAHVATALAYCMNIEITDASPPTEVFSSAGSLADGYAHCSNMPGNGLELNPQKLAEASVPDPVPAGIWKRNDISDLYEKNPGRIKHP